MINLKVHVLAPDILAVARVNTFNGKGDWSAYIGITDGEKTNGENIFNISREGAKLERKIAAAIFPLLAADENLAWRD